MTRETAIVGKAWEKAITAEEYEHLMAGFAEKGLSSGAQQEDLIYYTKLNAQRSKRVRKQAVISNGMQQVLSSLPPQKWLVITETWCGDAASSVPIIFSYAAHAPQVELGVVFRDENTELIDLFLTNGGRSIPKLIGLDEHFTPTFDWGPRPSGAQHLFLEWKRNPGDMPYQNFQVQLQKWYNEDKGKSLEKELMALLQ
jgi:hypothetical protein